MQITKFKRAEEYVREVEATLKKLPWADIERLAEILLRAHARGSKVIIMGNGGSASSASHFVCDLSKGAAMPGKKRFKALALCDNIPLMTAYANDCSYEDIFAQQLVNIVEKNDVVIAISGSGNSKNVLSAVKVARRAGARTVGLTGFKGGRLKSMVQFPLVVPNECMEQIEDIHLVILHAVKMVIIRRLAKR
ncbi:MAG: SIS domain-containing protein [Candidatus Omnitrophica bacterium]|nr:SIS domain-containing protein [Candidatus Omnitrophota bacterium]